MVLPLMRKHSRFLLELSTLQNMSPEHPVTTIQSHGMKMREKQQAAIMAVRECLSKARDGFGLFL